MDLIRTNALLISIVWLSTIFAAGQGFPTDHVFGDPTTPLTDLQIKEVYDYLVAKNATDIGLSLDGAGVIGKYWNETTIHFPSDAGLATHLVPDDTPRTPINVSALNLTVVPRIDSEITDFTIDSPA